MASMYFKPEFQRSQYTVRWLYCFMEEEHAWLREARHTAWQSGSRKTSRKRPGPNNPSEALHSSAVHFFLPGPTTEISDTSWQSRGNLSLSVDVIIDWIRALVIYLGKFLHKCIQRCTSLISEALLNQLSR